MEKRESRLYLVAEKLAAKRRMEAVRGLIGLVAGAVAGISEALAKPPYAYILAAVALIAGFLLADRLARRMPEYSLARGLLSFGSAFLLAWFSFYAAFIQ